MIVEILGYDIEEVSDYLLNSTEIMSIDDYKRGRK